MLILFLSLFLTVPTHSSSSFGKIKVMPLNAISKSHSFSSTTDQVTDHRQLLKLAMHLSRLTNQFVRTKVKKNIYKWLKEDWEQVNFALKNQVIHLFVKFLCVPARVSHQ
eukprot:NODE_761_length_4121_cov_0.819741.p5 type:complete len:110 gc:universal NODE_761_length_4121_cov_0.819741:4060-3731(-)